MRATSATLWAVVLMESTSGCMFRASFNARSARSASSSRSAAATRVSTSASWVRNFCTSRSMSRTGFRGMSSTIARPTSPPTSASRNRVTAGLPVPANGMTAVSSTDDVAACVRARPVSPTRVPTTTASATTRAICHAPRPMPRISSSPTRTPMATPNTSSRTVRTRAPPPEMSATMAAIGAKNACRWSRTSVAMKYAIDVARLSRSRSRHRRRTVHSRSVKDSPRGRQPQAPQRDVAGRAHPRSASGATTGMVSASAGG